MTVSGYARLRRGVQEHVERESQISEADVEAAVELFINHPEVGAEKAHLTLIDKEQALISAGFLNEVKKQLKDEAMSEKEKRRVASRLEEELKGRLARKRKEFVHIVAQAPHEIWATDFLQVWFLGMQLWVCVVYDVYSQAYLALEAGDAPDGQLAARALANAHAEAGRSPQRYVLSDNGKAFMSMHFEEILEQLQARYMAIPPGSPWFNGSLEASNGSLRATILTVGIQDFAKNPALSKQLANDVVGAVQQLQGYCDWTREILNHEIARAKFHTVPYHALCGTVRQQRARQEAFVARKTRQRRERMARLRSGEDRSLRKRLAEKVHHVFGRRLKAMNGDELFAFVELVHGRYQALAA